MRNGQILHVLSGSGSRGVFPNIDAVAPRAVLASAPRPVTLSGASLAVPDNAVLARCQGASQLCVYLGWAGPCRAVNWPLPFVLRWRLRRGAMRSWQRSATVRSTGCSGQAVQAGRCALTSTLLKLAERDRAVRDVPSLGTQIVARARRPVRAGQGGAPHSTRTRHRAAPAGARCARLLLPCRTRAAALSAGCRLDSALCGKHAL